MAKTPTTKPASAIDAPPPAPAPQPWAPPTSTEPTGDNGKDEPSEAIAGTEAELSAPLGDGIPDFARENEALSEPPAGTSLTPEELEANDTDPAQFEHAVGVADETVQAVEPAEVREQPADTNGNTSEDDAGHEDANGAGEEPEVKPIAPVEDKLTLGQDGDEANTGDVEVPEDEPTGDDGRPDGFVPGDQTAAGALTPPGGQHPGAPKGLHPGQAINLQDPYNVNGTQRNQELLAAGHGIKNPLLDQPDPNVVAAQSDAEDAKDD